MFFECLHQCDGAMLAHAQRNIKNDEVHMSNQLNTDQVLRLRQLIVTVWVFCCNDVLLLILSPRRRTTAIAIIGWSLVEFEVAH